MKRLTKACLISLSCVLTFSIGVAFAATITPKIVVNSNQVKTSTPPKIIDGAVYVPIRAISDGFGTSISWDNRTKTAYVNSDPNFKQEPSSVSYVANRNLVYRFIMAYDERDKASAMKLVSDNFKTDIYLEFPAGILNMGSIIDFKAIESVNDKFTVQIVQRVTAEDDYKIKAEKWAVTFSQDHKIESIKVVPNSTQYLDRYTVFPGATWGE
ncbi:copper amine oxidase N-terminal domain-containing protein [Paenibacillus sp. sptzw28]|uniref:copper amine oxidase N-terminal domain-containing protein n=1 Tax=Paenibacillus sp. sptzw28 TaxID=715179 RepID=UPI001C6F410D|nr:copper amine oxidase N-terminal domain-containing protein [Paenibacillus sp. sptzw28]QYR19162.1 copper amine oxidase N-terminal domain-containing protein [Paenibacillus sp. sptzw28]